MQLLGIQKLNYVKDRKPIHSAMCSHDFCSFVVMSSVWRLRKFLEFDLAPRFPKITSRDLIRPYSMGHEFRTPCISKRYHIDGRLNSPRSIVFLGTCLPIRPDLASLGRVFQLGTFCSHRHILVRAKAKCVS